MTISYTNKKYFFVFIAFFDLFYEFPEILCVYESK